MTDYPDIARQGVRLRKYGQEVIRVTAGKADSWHRVGSGRGQQGTDPAGAQ